MISLTSTRNCCLLEDPDPPLLKLANKSLLVGQYITLSCKARGGYPPPRLKLYLGDHLLETSVSGTSVQYTLKVRKSHEGAEVFCTATNIMSKHPVHSSVRVIKLKCSVILVLRSFNCSALRCS